MNAIDRLLILYILFWRHRCYGDNRQKRINDLVRPIDDDVSASTCPEQKQLKIGECDETLFNDNDSNFKWHRRHYIDNCRRH